MELIDRGHQQIIFSAPTSSASFLIHLLLRFLHRVPRHTVLYAIVAELIILMVFVLSIKVRVL
jgi:hypothetical protein